MSDYLYKPGDRVQVRDDLEEKTDMFDSYRMRSGPLANCWEPCERQVRFKGRIVIIKKCDGGYYIEPDPAIDTSVEYLCFVDDMFVGLAKRTPCFCKSLL